MGMMDRLSRALWGEPRRSLYPIWDDPAWSVTYNGLAYSLAGLEQSTPGERVEEVEPSFQGYASRLYAGNGVVFACMLTRLMVFSEARFQFRRLVNGRPGDLFGTASLGVLERPWPGGTTGDLLARAITDADLAGNFFATRRRDRIVRLRPDWVLMVLGVEGDVDATAEDLDAELLGIIYYPGGRYSGQPPEYLPREAIAHFAPIPDPLARYRGMSWLTPVIREVMGDLAATTHKLKFFENAGTPNLVIRRQDAPSKEAFAEWRSLIEAGHSGVANAYRNLYLTNGADATVVGKDLQQLEFKATQGAGETRIAAASGIHPVVVGLSEGLAGSSLNAGNFGSARRLTADKTFRPLWRNLAGSLEVLVPPPQGAQLWYDDRDVAFLREDRKDAAEIQQIKATTVRTYVDAGFDPLSAVEAVESEDPGMLRHSGLFSVQLQPPGTGQEEPNAVAPGE